MAIEITRPGKYSLIVSTPVMPAAGTLGFADSYKGLIDYDKLGALVTNPVTIEPWNPASGTRMIPLDAGVLLHTGLAQSGLVQSDQPQPQGMGEFDDSGNLALGRHECRQGGSGR